MIKNIKVTVNERLPVNRANDLIYEDFVNWIISEGYPVGVKEANVNDFVCPLLNHSIAEYKKVTKKDIYLQREKEIVSLDKEAGGNEVFVVDYISVNDGLKNIMRRYHRRVEALPTVIK